MRSVLFLVALLGLNCILAEAAKKLVCYYGSWATYRAGTGKFDAEDIDPTLCTHVIYSFVGLNADGTIKLLDSWNDIDKRGFARFVALKTRNPSLKVMVAIGGWNEGSATYSSVANNPSLRNRFVNDAVTFLRKYNFDGLDLDWEYPAQRGGAPSDIQAFSLLCKELQAKFRSYGLILSAAVGSTASHRMQSYEVPKLNQYLDFVNIMSYDLHGSWESVTGQNSPLYDRNSALSVSGIVNDWLSAGLASEKLIIGIGLYGRSFTLSNSANSGVGAPASGGGLAGPTTSEPGILSYSEICRNRWTEKWDDFQKVPYAVKGKQWVGYDNVKSVTLKAQLAVSKNLGGVMVWAIDYEDKSGACGAGKFPLLTSIQNLLRSSGGGSSSGSSSESSESNTPTKPTTTRRPQTPKPQPTKPPGNIRPPPPTSRPSGSNPCYKSGLVADPKDSKVFYECEKSGNEFVSVRAYVCQGDLFFDSRINACSVKSR